MMTATETHQSLDSALIWNQILRGQIDIEFLGFKMHLKNQNSIPGPLDPWGQFQWSTRDVGGLNFTHVKRAGSDGCY